MGLIRTLTPPFAQDSRSLNVTPRFCPAMMTTNAPEAAVGGARSASRITGRARPVLMAIVSANWTQRNKNWLFTDLGTVVPQAERRSRPNVGVRSRSATLATTSKYAESIQDGPPTPAMASKNNLRKVCRFCMNPRFLTSDPSTGCRSKPTRLPQYSQRDVKSSAGTLIPKPDAIAVQFRPPRHAGRARHRQNVTVSSARNSTCSRQDHRKHPRARSRAGRPTRDNWRRRNSETSHRSSSR